MKRIVALLLALLFCATQALACSCGWAGPFLTVANSAETIIVGTVRAHAVSSGGIQRAMDVEVVEVLKGSIDQSRIRVWGDNGMLCRPYVSQFPVGTTWVLAVDSKGMRMPDEEGYTLSVCGEYWLKVSDGTVTGILSGSEAGSATEHMSLQELRERL